MGSRGSESFCAVSRPVPHSNESTLLAVEGCDTAVDEEGSKHTAMPASYLITDLCAGLTEHVWKVN